MDLQKSKPLAFWEAADHVVCVLHLWMVLFCLLTESALAFLEVEGAFFDAFFYITHIKEN